jgi:hypothetical protein
LSNVSPPAVLLSLALYSISVPLAYVHPAITLSLAFIVSAIYFLPHAWIEPDRPSRL